MAVNGRPHLASALDIERWADSLEARGELPRLVRRLIRQTNDQVIVLDMGAAEATGAPGYDGRVEALKGTPFVPRGKSVWEIGTGNDPGSKANRDYATRTRDSLGVSKPDTVFVFVTCRRWDEKRDWEDEKRKDGAWRDVRAFDVQDIEQALESAPAAHTWLSEVLGKPVAGVETLAEWWAGFSNSTLPTLSPELVLADRADEASLLLRFLEQEPHVVTISAPSQDDVIAFVAAVILSSPEETRFDLLARALIVHDAYSLRQLDRSADLLILVPFDNDLRRDALRVRSHHVVLLAEYEVAADVPLPAIAIESTSSLLKDLGVDEDRATKLAQAANRSLIAFQREAQARPGVARRDWSTFFMSKPIRRAWLAGGWSEQRSGDIDAISTLLGQSYDDARDDLLKASRGPDPLFTVTGHQWARVLPEAALPYCQPSISLTDLKQVEETIQNVLGAVDPALELPIEDRWKASLYGKTRIHSSALRDGLATTLAILGVVGASISLGSGRTGQTWSESAVFRLLDRANADRTGQLWASLSDVLPLIAEAAPDVFLRAVGEGSAGTEPVLRKMFLDDPRGNAISVSSPHTGLLWALEGVAWSAEHLSLAAELLARLAEIDPGGRLSNRPSESISSIFRPWLPQTSSSADARLHVLDGIYSRHEQVGWNLILDLLPEHYAVGGYTHAPRFRHWKPESQNVTRKEYLDVSSAVAQRVIELTGTDPSRWVQLLEHISDLPPGPRSAALDRLTHLADDPHLSGEARREIWDAVHSVVRHHRSFQDADWAMATEDVDRLSDIGNMLRPEDPVAASLWLFKSYVSELEERRHLDIHDHEGRVGELREQAVRAIFTQEGMGGLVRAVQASESPWSLGHATAKSDVGVNELNVLDLLDDPDTKKVEFACGFASVRSATEGWAWTQRALARVDGRPFAQARVLLMSDRLSKAWERARELGKEVEVAYWQEFVPYGRGKEFPLINEAAEKLLAHGRVAAAIDALAMYSHNGEVEVDSDLVARALEALVDMQGKDPELARVSSYEIETLLEYIRPRIDEDRAGLLEWRLLPALGPFAASPVLDRRLARKPEFFIEILSLCFRPRSTKPETEVPTRIATNAWHLLHQWKIVPGSDEVGGVVDEQQLQMWLNGARELARRVDRAEIADNYIGQVFAHARSDEDGTWPTLPVRHAVEEIASPDLEDGLRVGTFNTRGVSSRSLTEGGRQERDLAVQYREYATRIQEGWPRTAAVLRGIADEYESQARSHDEQAERILKGVDY